jgi:hypothetical protein
MSPIETFLGILGKIFQKSYSVAIKNTSLC